MRKSERIPPSSSRMPTQMKTLFFDEGGIRKLPRNFVQIHVNPAIYLVQNFLTCKEMEYFDSMCTQYGNKFKASYTTNDHNEEVISEERTSRFIHLSKGQDKYARRIEQRAAELVGLAAANVEPLQIVTYGPGQQFTQHHDAGTLLEDGSVPCMISPRRLITFFLYLNSMPEGEGHTEFPLLGLSVRPERNSALLFCNTSYDMNKPDPLVVHCAKPLSSSPTHPSLCHKKWGVNIWLTDTDLSELSFVKTNIPLVKASNYQSNSKKRSFIQTEGNSDIVHEGALEKAERLYNLWMHKSLKKPHLRKGIVQEEEENIVYNCGYAEKNAQIAKAKSSALPSSFSQSLIIAQDRLKNISRHHPISGHPLIHRRMEEGGEG